MSVVARDPGYINWMTAGKERCRARLKANERAYREGRMNSEPRSLEQNDLLHPWCREIANHINEEAGRAVVSEYRIKELVKAKLGNVVRTEAGELACDVPMPTSKYRRTEADMTDAERRAGFISMDQFLAKIQAWAATDLGLELKSREDRAA